jgi:WD40 repeat protein
VETTSPIQKYEAHGYTVLDIAVSGDNSRFASVGGDRQVFLWDVEQGGTVRRWSGHNARVEAVQFAGEGDTVVVSGMFLDFFFLTTSTSATIEEKTMLYEFSQFDLEGAVYDNAPLFVNIISWE